MTFQPVELESCSNPIKKQKVSSVRFLKIWELLGLNFLGVTSLLREVRGFLDDVIRA